MCFYKALFVSHYYKPLGKASQVLKTIIRVGGDFKAIWQGDWWRIGVTFAISFVPHNLIMTAVSTRSRFSIKTEFSRWHKQKFFFSFCLFCVLSSMMKRKIFVDTSKYHLHSLVFYKYNYGAIYKILSFNTLIRMNLE